MELLAPAGNLPAFDAALSEGADAFYVGAPKFNARSLARDLTYSEIATMIETAHSNGKKLYIAMNSLIKEDEIPKAIEALEIFSRLKPDALIIQDLGLLYLAKKFFPHLALHASTLMSAHNSQAVKWLSTMGFERIVLARELSLNEINTISKRTRNELEVFVHGAMCFSYSGLCLFSSLHGGKSSLRGKCVQPCRRQYTWLQSKDRRFKSKKVKSRDEYLFSMNDLCGIDLLPQLQKAGVTCLKIEGRLKSAQYVRKTVQAYRLALDSISLPEKERKNVLIGAHHLLDEAMGRRRAPGYFLSTKPDTIISPKTSGTSGLFLGKIQQPAGKQRNTSGMQDFFYVKLLESLFVGDRVRLHDDISGERLSFTVSDIVHNQQGVKSGSHGMLVFIMKPRQLVGKPLGASRYTLFKVDVKERKDREKAAGQRRALLKKKIIKADPKRVKKIIDALSWTPTFLSAKIKYKKGKRPDRIKTENRKQKQDQGALYLVRVQSLADINQRMPIRPYKFLVPLNKVSVPRKSKSGRKGTRNQSRIIWAIPSIIHEADIAWYQKIINELIESGYSEFQLAHCSHIEFFHQSISANRKKLKFYGDYTLNLLNSLSVLFTEQLGMDDIQFSIESDKDNLALSILNYRRNKNIHRKNKAGIGLLIYGRIPLFTSRAESGHLQCGKLFSSPKNEVFEMNKGDGLTYAVAKSPFSLCDFTDEIFKVGVTYLVVDFSGGSFKSETQTFSKILNKTAKKQPILSGNFNNNLL